MDSQRLSYLNAMGIPVYVRRHSMAQPRAATPKSKTSVTDKPLTDAESGPAPTETLSWADLRQQVKDCKLCALCETRTQTVFGTGSESADWLFIGEAPGQEEDRQGEPFVGRAGQLLNSMLQAIGLRREQVFIANILKCRPPDNRDPKPEETRSCQPYLRRQIELLQPRVIVALGRIAAQGLLETDTPIGRLRGRKHVYADMNIPLVVTYHPAYLLRSPREKHKSWQDLLLAKQSVITVSS